MASLAALLTAAGLMFVSAVTDLPFHTKGEPREALVVRNMIERNEYVLVLRNGDEIPSKPPLFHWLGVVAAKTVGDVNEAVVRVPSVAAALGLIGLTALLGFRAWGTAGGLAAAAALITSQQFIASATSARVDMVLAACVSAAIASAWLALSTDRPVSLIFYFALALGVLAKGPVGLVLPASVAVAYALARKRIPPLSDLRVVPGLLILLIPLLWYAAAWSVGGDAFVDKLFFKENIYRVLDPDSVQAGHVKPFWFYIPSLLGSAAPWSLCLPALAVVAWNERDTLDDDGRLMPILWLVITVALFSLSPSKRSVYLLPCFPAVALLAGNWAVSATVQRRLSGVGRAIVFGLAGLFAVAIVLIALESVGVRALGWIEPFVGNEADRANLAVLVLIAESMRGRLLAWALASLIMLTTAAYSAIEGRRLVAFAAFAILIATTTGVAGLPMQKEMARRGSIEPFMRRVAPIIPPDEPVYFYGGVDYAAAYYLARPIPRVEAKHAPGLAPELAAGPASARNRVWYFVWEQSVEELCAGLVQIAHPNDGANTNYSCTERDRYDFHANPKLDDLILIEARREHRARTNRATD